MRSFEQNGLAIENGSHILLFANQSQESSTNMYVCVCNAIRESELRHAARHTSGDAEACYAALGKRPDCRQCLDDADIILLEEREAGGNSLAA